VRLQPGDTLQVLFGSPPRLLAEVPATRPVEGDEGIRLTLDLPAGASEIRLVSSRPEAPVPDEPQGASFALLLPVLAWPEPPGALSPRAPSAIVPADPPPGPPAVPLAKGLPP
jgi:hypothetical protein